jgi:hypothetical protein
MLTGDREEVKCCLPEKRIVTRTLRISVAEWTPRNWLRFQLPLEDMSEKPTRFSACGVSRVKQT